MKKTVIELLVNDHPGVLYRITGLFARKGFNLEGLIVSSVKNENKSKIFLLVEDNAGLEKIKKQIEKNYDVLKFSYSENVNKDAFCPEAA